MKADATRLVKRSQVRGARQNRRARTSSLELWSEAVERNEADGFFTAGSQQDTIRTDGGQAKLFSTILRPKPISGVRNDHCLPAIILIKPGYFGKGLSGYLHQAYIAL